MTVPTRRGVLAGLAAGLAGCSSILPEESEPIEASANSPAELPESTDYELVTSAEPTIETTVTVDFSGDVELTSRQDVIATLFQRVYRGPDDRRFGLLTAPAVKVVEEPEVIRDPVVSLDDARVVELATGHSVASVSEWEDDEAATLLGTETQRSSATLTIEGGGGGDRPLLRARVRAGEDSVTAMAAGYEDDTPPFEDVVRES